VSTPRRIVDARLEPYALPFVRPWRSARADARARAGWLVHLRDDRGDVASGECAPWPEAGTESPAECAAALDDLLAALTGVSVEEALAAQLSLPGSPAARCGVEGALLGLAAAARGCPLRQLLAGDPADSIEVNAACGAADASLADAVTAAGNVGFRVFKIKVGVGPWHEELGRLRALALPPDAGLRLDANGAWDAGEAEDRCRDLAGLPIECLEEPLQRYDPGALAALQAMVPFPLALDESLAGRAAAVIADGCPVQRVVLKPMVLGGARATVHLAREAAAGGVDSVVTTTLEAAPGRLLVAETAAAIGSRLAHGLDTGRWFARDLGAGPRIERGRIRLGAA
jgi:o-succinylbenzoate synthase